MTTRPSRAGQLSLVQFMSVEVAALGAAAARYAFPSLPMTAIGLAAALLVLPAVARYRGRWWYEAVGAWLLLRERRDDSSRAAVLARAAGPHWPDLAALSPRLVVRTVADRNLSVGVGEDHLGWFAAIAIASPDGLSRNARGPLRLEWITRLADPLTTVQVVARHTPYSDLGQPPTPNTESYRALRDALAVPPQRDVWVAVRIGQRDAATVAAERGGDAIHRTLGSTLSRISDALASNDLDHRVLDVSALQQALQAAYGPEPYDPRRPRRAPGESWSSWRAGRTLHVCFGVTRWPASAPPDLLAQLADVPGATAVCTAVVAGAIRRPDDTEGPLGVRVLVRVVTSPETATSCLRHLHTTARRLGVGLVRLDGEQGPAVYATMPTAATDGWGRYW